MTNQPNAEGESDQLAVSFPDRREKPSTKEYLDASLEEVLDRLNKNPNGLESEAAFINSVITVRHARVIEKLNKRLVRLTGVAAIATAVLVFVPFVVPSLEAQRLEAKVDSTQTAMNGLKAEGQLLKQEIQELRGLLTTLSEQRTGFAPRPANMSLQKGNGNTQ